MKVMDLNPRLVSEIASYKRPKPCIQDVMKATYIVLGEKQETLDVSGSWCNVELVLTSTRLLIKVDVCVETD